MHDSLNCLPSLNLAKAIFKGRILWGFMILRFMI
jgi:hypothetical protein